MSTNWILVDDDPTFLRQLKDSFTIFAKSLGQPPKILVATNVTEALLLVQNETPRLIITDIQMPQVDGFQFLRLVNRKYPNIHKVVVSGQLSPKTEALCIQVGVALTVGKPANVQELASLFKKVHQLSEMPSSAPHPVKESIPHVNKSNPLLRVTGKIVRRGASPSADVALNSVLGPQSPPLEVAISQQNSLETPLSKEAYVRQRARITGLITRGASVAASDKVPSAACTQVTPQIDTPLKEAETVPKGFSGVLPKINLAELVQMLFLSNKSSVLRISGDHINGHIYIEEGQIIHAETVDLIGEKAVYKILNLEGGQFDLLSYTPPSQRSVNVGTQHLLIEAARLMDESEKTFAETQCQKTYPARQTTSVTSTISVHEEHNFVFYEKKVSSDTTTQFVEKKEIHKETFSYSINPQEDLDELIVCDSGGRITYQHGTPDSAQRVDLLEFFSFKNRQLAESSLGSLHYIHLIGSEMESLITLNEGSSVFARTQSRPIPLANLLNFTSDRLCLPLPQVN